MSLLQMSFSGTVMIFIVIVVRALWIHKLPKKVFLILWGTVLFRLLIPVSVPLIWSIYSILERNTEVIDTVKNNPIGKILPVNVRIQTKPITATISAQTNKGMVNSWMIIWGIGLFVCTAFFILTYIRCYREFQTSLPVEEKFIEEWLKTHKTKRKISVRQSGIISAPLTYGILHPIILMPKKTEWKESMQLRYILAHEYVHIQRFDAMKKLILTAAVCIHWFNPMVWGMYILANRDIELSCDETVVRKFGEDSRSAYALTLICMEEKKSGLMPFGSNFSKNAIEERITAIMKMKKTSMLVNMSAAILIVGIVTTFATSSASGFWEQSEQHSDSETEFSENILISGDEDREFQAQIQDEMEKQWEETLAPYLPFGLTYEYDKSKGYNGFGLTMYYQGKEVRGIMDERRETWITEHAGDSGYAEDAVELYAVYEGDTLIGLREATEEENAQWSEMRQQTAKEQKEWEEKLHTIIPKTETGSVLSYIKQDGETYYSWDDGKTWIPLTDEEYEDMFPTSDVEWWTYEEYKEWLDNEKVQLQNIIGEKGWTSARGEFVWTQAMVDEAIALYEEILQELKDGKKVSKSVNGDENVMLFQGSGETIQAKEIEFDIVFDDGEEATFGPYETTEDLLAGVKAFGEEQVKDGKMTQEEEDEIIKKLL